MCRLLNHERTKTLVGNRGASIGDIHQVTNANLEAIVVANGKPARPGGVVSHIELANDRFKHAEHAIDARSGGLGDDDSVLRSKTLTK